MHKLIFRLFILCIFIAVSSPAFAQKGWRLFAGTEEDFVFNPTLSFLGGVLSSNQEVGGNNTVYGLEAAFVCPLIQSPDNAMRQQVSYVYYDKDGNTLQTVEANLHYLFNISNDFKLGVGPGIGYVRTEVSNVTSNMLAMQIGSSLHYSIKQFFIGAEYRYQMTQRSHVGKGTNNGADNWRGLLKLGYYF